MKSYSTYENNYFLRRSVQKDFDDNGNVIYIERVRKHTYKTLITAYHNITAGRAKRIARNHRERITPYACGMGFRKLKFKGSWPNAVMFTYDSRSRKLYIRVSVRDVHLISEKLIDKPEGFR